MSKIKRIDHVAIVVDEFDKALPFWEGTLGLRLENKKSVPEQKVSIALLKIGDSELELVRPDDEDSGVAQYLKSRGPGMHHICLEVEGLDDLMLRLKEQEIKLINEEPVGLSNGTRMVFIHPKSTNGVLVELYEKPVGDNN